MHELGITQEIVEICCRRSEGACITRIVLEIGKLSGVLPDAVRFCFDLCSEGTMAEGAQLEIIEPLGSAHCRECGNLVQLLSPWGICECGSTNLEWLSGEELRIKEMEVN
jgi:hydrogenase nickel incorporation protein HypA/HybF